LENEKVMPKEEDPAAKAKLITALLRGRLKEQLEKGGGREAFLSWVRSDSGKPM
jgi:hypothetical protein